jgi:hypothetical protein
MYPKCLLGNHKGGDHFEELTPGRENNENFDIHQNSSGGLYR